MSLSIKINKIICLLFLVTLILFTASCSAVEQSIKSEDKQVAITIDMSFGDDDYTEEILSVLDKLNVKASFFIVGMLAEKKPILIKRLASYGMDIENHSYSHKNYTLLNDEEIVADANKTNELILNQGIETNKYIRPPFNVVDDRIKNALANAGYTVVLGLDSRDWERNGFSSIVSNILDSVQPGDILMFQSNVMDTPAAIEKIITTLRERGYKIVPLNELIAGRE
ncbi:MAG: polysaccharide deacetylase family protein [Eubacteriales bacterium]